MENTIANIYKLGLFLLLYFYFFLLFWSVSFIVDQAIRLSLTGQHLYEANIYKWIFQKYINIF
jgi:hypothetical protein